MDERKDWELNAESELRLEVSEQEVRIRVNIISLSISSLNVTYVSVLSQPHLFIYVVYMCS